MKGFALFCLFILMDLACYHVVPKDYRKAHRYSLIPGGGFVLIYQYNQDRHAPAHPAEQESQP